jgi:GTP-binding protein EngB required for normal cell division
MTDKALFDSLRKKATQLWRRDINKPLTVSVMGQTGVGKSSLINALFGTQFKTSAVQPCTKEIEEHIERDESGRELRFYDLPGIGEASADNEIYLKAYRQKLEESDVVLWAIHADNRSFTFDLNALRQILEGFSPEQQGQAFSKITFILTKVDLLKVDPWILFVQDENGIFTPGPKTKELLAEKVDYCQAHFIRPYSNLLVSTTYREGESELTDPSFTFEEDYVHYHGLMTEAQLKALTQQYPTHTKLLNRLFGNYQVIPCSSLFRFNLQQLMRVVIDKLGTSAIGRFSRFINPQEMSQVPIAQAKTFGNIVAADTEGNTLYDLDNLKESAING